MGHLTAIETLFPWLAGLNVTERKTLPKDYIEGIKEVQNDNLISIFPNPTHDELQIQRAKVSDKQTIQILNYTGQVLYDNANFIGTTIDMRQLADGIYLLRYSDTKSFSMKKFIVQH